MADVRTNILIATARLIQKQGYHATGLNEIIKESGAPKGSVYYYFPEGKEQIGAEAILEAGKIIAGRLRGLLSTDLPPAEAVYDFIMHMANNVEEMGFGAGSPLTTAAVETANTSERINNACQDAFEIILAVFKDMFLATGFGNSTSNELSLFVTTVIEGGLIMSRTYHKVEPLQIAASHLHSYLSSVNP